MPTMASPYTVGATVQVKTERGVISVKIEEILSHERNFTVLKVKCEDNPEEPNLNGKTVVLKLFDRRFAYDARHRYGIPPTTPLLEELYRADVLEKPPFSPTTDSYQKKEDDDTESDDESDMESIFDVEPHSHSDNKVKASNATSASTRRHGDETEEEGYETDATEECDPRDSDHEDDVVDEESWPCRRLRHVQYFCLRQHFHEVAVYKELRYLQGNRVPKFYASVQLLEPPENKIPEGATDQVKDLLQTMGIIVEFIPGETLLNSFGHILPTEWQDNLQTALDTVNRISICPVIFHGASPDNIIMRWKEGVGYEAVMLDFSRVRTPKWHVPDECWGVWKWNANDEGKIGRLVAQKIGLFFEESIPGTYKWSEWSEEDGAIPLPPPVNPHLRPKFHTCPKCLSNQWGSWAIALPSLLHPDRYPVIRGYDGYDYNAEYSEDLNWGDFNWEDYDLPVEGPTNTVVANEPAEASRTAQVQVATLTRRFSTKSDSDSGVKFKL